MAVFSAIAGAIIGAFATAGGWFLTTAGALTTAGTILSGVIAGDFILKGYYECIAKNGSYHFSLFCYLCYLGFYLYA